MTHPNHDSVKYHYGKLSPLIGSVIKDIVIDNSDSFDVFFGFVLETKDKKEKVVWFLSDEEGNAPGAIDIQEK